MSRPPKYGIIYNWDGAPHGYSAVPQSMEDFLEKAYAPLEDTQVGALFWSVGEHRALWSSQVLEVVGEAQGRRYDSAASYTATENVRQMLDRDEDPHTALIARGRQLGLQVYASIRMNDNHFAGAQIADLPALYKAGKVTRRRFEHPEWLLGEEAPEWFALSWNMAVPEVREHRFAHIREICRRYDWDGVELDWQRHAFHFPRDQGYRLRYLLTDVQRAVRRLARELAAERGRPFHVAARVAGSLEMCQRIGYDVPAWIEEDLADVLIPAGGAVTDASLEVEAFVDLCRDTSIAVYPGFDSGLPDPFVGPEEVETKDQMRTRAIASRYHRAGADGIYVFNWHANRDSKRPLLTTIGSAATLRHTDKIYAATHRFVQRQGPWRGAYWIDRLHGQVPVALKRTLMGQGPEIVLELADDARADGPASVELRLRLDQWVEGDEVRAAWDGAELQGVALRYCDLADANPPGGAFQPLPSRRHIGEASSAVWLCFRLDPPAPGAHRVGIDLVERHAQMDCDIVLTDVEVVFRYGAEAL